MAIYTGPVRIAIEVAVDSVIECPEIYGPGDVLDVLDAATRLADYPTIYTLFKVVGAYIKDCGSERWETKFDEIERKFNLGVDVTYGS